MKENGKVQKFLQKIPNLLGRDNETSFADRLDDLRRRRQGRKLIVYCGKTYEVDEDCNEDLLVKYGIGYRPDYDVGPRIRPYNLERGESEAVKLFDRGLPYIDPVWRDNKIILYRVYWGQDAEDHMGDFA